MDIKTFSSHNFSVLSCLKIIMVGEGYYNGNFFSLNIDKKDEKWEFTLSYKVLEGTPYFLDAWRALMPAFTSSMAARMSSLVYCLYRFHSAFPLAPTTRIIPGAGGVSSEIVKISLHKILPLNF